MQMMCLLLVYFSSSKFLIFLTSKLGDSSAKQCIQSLKKHTLEVKQNLNT